MSRDWASVNGPQKKWSSGKFQRRGLDRSRQDRVHQVADRRLPRSPLGGVLAGEPVDDRDQRDTIALQQPEDGRRRHRRKRRSRVDRDAGLVGPQAARRAGRHAGLGRRRCLERLLAVGRRLPGVEARLVGGLRRDPRRVGLDRQPVERPGQVARRLLLARGVDEAVRASWLMRLISRSQSRAAASTCLAVGRPAAACPEGSLRLVLGSADRARVRRARRLLGLEQVLVVGTLCGPEGFLGSFGLDPRARRHLAALVGYGSQLAARGVGRRAAGGAAGGSAASAAAAAARGAPPRWLAREGRSA